MGIGYMYICRVYLRDRGIGFKYEELWTKKQKRERVIDWGIGNIYTEGYGH